MLKLFLNLGQSAFLVRLPSALAGTATVGLLVGLGSEIGQLIGKKIGLGVLGGALLALCPLHVWYAQEARMYALTAALGTAAAWCACRFATRGRVPAALGYFVLGTAALFSDQSALPTLLLVNLVWLLWWRKQGQRWQLGLWAALQTGSAGLFGLWWSKTIIAQQASAGTAYQLTMLQLTLGRLGIDLSSNVILVVVLASAVGGMAIVLGIGLYLWRHLPRQQIVRWLTWIIVVCFVLGTVGAAIPRLMTVKRLLVNLLPYMLLFAAWALLEIRSKWWIGASLGFSLVLAFGSIVINTKEPWQDAVEAMEAEWAAGEMIWVDELGFPAYNFYAKTTQTTRQVWMARDIEKLDAGNGEHTWFVARTDRYRDLFDLVPGLNKVDPVWMQTWPGIEIRAYKTAILTPHVLHPTSEIPAWIMNWPSPIDKACQGYGND